VPCLPRFDRLMAPGVGVADPDFRRGNGSVVEVLVHCGGVDTCDVDGRVYIDEIDLYALGWGLGALAKCGASEVTPAGRWVLRVGRGLPWPSGTLSTASARMVVCYERSAKVIQPPHWRWRRS
jgi:hypothetical protein